MKTKHLISRWTGTRAPLYVACLALIGSGAIVGVGGSAASATTKHKPKTVTITFWNAYNDVTETPVMNGIVIPAFERLHPHIKVIDETLPYDGMLNKFIAASAAGNPPSLMRSDIAWVPQLASEGILLETSKQKWFAAVKRDAFPGPMSTNYWKGGYWGIPDDTNTQVLFYNKADFAAANLTPPTTWAQMMSDAQALTNPATGQHGLGVDSTDIWNVGPLVWAYGGSFTNANSTKASGYMDSAKTQAAVQQLVTFQQTGVIGSDFAGGSGAISGETGFPTGQYAMYLDGPWATTTYKNANFTGYGTSVVPGNPKSASVVGGEDFVVPKNAKNMAQVITFLRFLQSPTAQLGMVTAGSMTPYRSDAVHEAVINPALKIFSQQLQTAKARPVNQYYGKLDTAFSNQVALMLAGKVTVAQGLATAAQQSDAALQGHG
jgi:multiple sugar transport system substrate-binding protein